MATRKLAPSTADVALGSKLSEGAALWRSHRSNAADFEDLLAIFNDLDEYDELLRREAGMPLACARVFEIGFGARPYRLAALQSMGVAATGIDAERPLLRVTPAELARIWHTNGAERAAKSLVRHLAFDRRERRRLHQELGQRGYAYRLDRRAMTIGDAAEAELEPGSIDLIYSEDVFEHIRRRSLEPLVDRMARWLSPTGIALIRPNIWTGITGGHLIEWNRRSLRHPPAQRRTRPWQHLYGETEANTSLNRLTRREYRALFEQRFTVVEERVKLPDLGAEYLTPQIARELAEWPREELFSNQVLFVLRPRRR